MTETDSFTMTIYDRVLDHFKTSWLVHDQAEVSFDENELELKAHVSSGDYFATLATRLDHLSDAIRQSEPAASMELQRLVRQLMLLQQRYKIEKN